MDMSERLLGGWNLSMAGCGFRSVYHLGVLRCFLDHTPQLVHGASRVGGASSGCLVAAALAVGIPIEQLCAEVLAVAREARRHLLGVFHPTFNLLHCVRDILLEKLPADAHLKASGRLCVSLTRLADGKNLLVTHFHNRDELVQVLLCSCFFPVYCGFTAPSYRGVRYMDGALSNNMPLSELRNTITMAPFAGESDVCPREGTFCPLQVHYGNVSIKVTTRNIHRICTSFLPPRLEMLAEICHSGYTDAVHFLLERGLLRRQGLPPCVAWVPCCQAGLEPQGEDHSWLDPKVIQKLPLSFRTVLCEAYRAAKEDTATLPTLLLLRPLLVLLMLPLRLGLLLLTSVMSSGAEAAARLATRRSLTQNCSNRTRTRPRPRPLRPRRSRRK